SGATRADTGKDDKPYYSYRNGDPNARPQPAATSPSSGSSAAAQPTGGVPMPKVNSFGGTAGIAGEGKGEGHGEGKGPTYFRPGEQTSQQVPPPAAKPKPKPEDKQKEPPKP